MVLFRRFRPDAEPTESGTTSGWWTFPKADPTTNQTQQSKHTQQNTSDTPQSGTGTELRRSRWCTWLKFSKLETQEATQPTSQPTQTQQSDHAHPHSSRSRHRRFSNHTQTGQTQQHTQTQQPTSNGSSQPRETSQNTSRWVGTLGSVGTLVSAVSYYMGSTAGTCLGASMLGAAALAGTYQSVRGTGWDDGYSTGVQYVLKLSKRERKALVQGLGD